MFDTAHGWLKTFTDFGVSIILAGVVIDVLFQTGLVTEQIGALVASFSEKGLAGFIALLLFVIFWQKRGETAASS